MTGRQTNTNQNRTAIIKAGYAQFSNIKWAASASYTCVVSDQNIKKSDILLTGIRIVGSTAENYGLRFWVDDGYISCNCTSLIAGNNTTKAIRLYSTSVLTKKV